jgi:Uncharacterized conserved protein
VIKSANQYAVHELFSFEGNLTYRVPPYQREYSWQKVQWEDLFQDLVENDEAHFLGTIITLNQTVDAVANGVLELIDGQQRATTLSLLLAAIYSVLRDHKDELDEEGANELFNLGKRLVSKSGQIRVSPQVQGHNRDDYLAVLADAGLKVEQTSKHPYFKLRRIYKCYEYFRQAITRLAESNGWDEVKAALSVLDAAKRAIVVKIEVASHADAFVLFESLNNRGMPLTPVDLIKNHLLAVSELRGAMNVDEAFKLWNEILANLGDNYANQERFLRHYYNAFKAELPPVPNTPIATRSKLIGIYETLLATDVRRRAEDLLDASRLYGRITCIVDPDEPTSLDEAFRQLMRAQGSPSYVLVMWLLRRRSRLGLTEDDLGKIVRRLTSFFVRRNLTGYPQTYALPRLFMTMIEQLGGLTGTDLVDAVTSQLVAVSSGDEEFRKRLDGPIYEENTDVTRFLLATLAEDKMTKETWTDLWAQEKGHFVWTIEHILPQGANLPASWREMLGGAEAAAAAQETHVHRLGNLTITAYNSTLGNKSFIEKRDRVDARGNHIGYRNGLSLNADLATRETWTVADIDARTKKLVDKVLWRFPLA